MKTRCPNCGKIHEAPDSYEGRTVKCPHCKQSFEAIKQQDVIVSQTTNKPKSPEGPAGLKLPHDDYLYGAGTLGIIISVLMVLGGLINESDLVACVGMICGALSFILYGLGSITHAINANTLRREKK